MEFNYESLNMKFNKICFKFAKIIRALDGDIKKNLKAAGYETRPVESNGIWCCLLLPVVLIMNTFLQKISISYQITTFIAVGLMFYSMLFIIFLSISTLILREPIYGGCTTCSLLSTILITVFGGQATAQLVRMTISGSVFDSTMKLLIWIIISMHSTVILVRMVNKNSSNITKRC